MILYHLRHIILSIYALNRWFNMVSKFVNPFLQILPSAGSRWLPSSPCPYCPPASLSIVPKRSIIRCSARAASSLSIIERILVFKVVISSDSLSSRKRSPMVSCSLNRFSSVSSICVIMHRVVYNLHIKVCALIASRAQIRVHECIWQPYPLVPCTSDSSFLFKANRRSRHYTYFRPSYNMPEMV